MIINIDTSIRKKWHKGFERKKNIERTTIVLHGAGEADSTRALINWMLTGQRKSEYIRGEGLFHYAIDRNGETTEIINPEFWTFHSGSGMFDAETVGIELINGDARNFNSYTDRQFESLFELIFDKLIIDYPTIKSIASHGRLSEKYSGKYKNCPGNFNFEKLEKYMDENGYNYIHNEEYESYWKIEKKGGR